MYSTPDFNSSTAYTFSTTINPDDREITKPRPWMALIEVVSFDIGLHLFDRYILNAEYAQTTWDTIKYNLRHGFVWDNDNIATNLFWHPYTGGLYFNAARSNGIGFWTSIPYAFGGSLLWECFGESEPASINDLVATPVGGIAFGEITHRLSHLVLDDSKRGWSRFGREFLAGIISPMGLLNRLIHGDAWHYRPPFENDKSTYLRQPFVLNVGFNQRYIDDEGDKQNGKFYSSIFSSLLYGRPFTETWRRPYDYFLFSINFNFTGNQPFISQASATALIWGHEWGQKNNYWLAGIFQHFDFYDANPVVKNEEKPYEFAETASFGGGLLYKLQKDENKNEFFYGGIYLNAVLLGASESDHYHIDQRDYNLGSGYSVKLHGLLTLTKRWSFFTGYKLYHFFTWRGYGSEDEEKNGLSPDRDYHYANIQGNKGNSLITLLSFKVDYRLSSRFSLSLEEHLFYSKIHYTYLEDIKASSSETCIKLTYTLINR